MDPQELACKQIAEIQAELDKPSPLPIERLVTELEKISSPGAKEALALVALFRKYNQWGKARNIEVSANEVKLWGLETELIKPFTEEGRMVIFALELAVY